MKTENQAILGADGLKKKSLDRRKIMETLIQFPSGELTGRSFTEVGKPAAIEMQKGCEMVRSNCILTARETSTEMMAQTVDEEMDNYDRPLEARHRHHERKIRWLIVNRDELRIETGIRFSLLSRRMRRRIVRFAFASSI